MAIGIDQITGALGSRLGRRGMLGGMLGASALALAACGVAAGAGQASGSTATPNTQKVNMTVMGSIKLGPDGKMHDAFTPADFTVSENRPVEVTVYSYDNAPHSVTAPDLKLNAIITPAAKDGVPAVTSFTFTPTKSGKFLWSCDLACDGDANGWAMANPGYMSGYITVVPA